MPPYSAQDIYFNIYNEIIKIMYMYTYAYYTHTHARTHARAHAHTEYYDSQEIYVIQVVISDVTKMASTTFHC